MIQLMRNLNLRQRCYKRDTQTAKGKYDQNNSIKFETKSMKSSLCDYYDAFILVAGNITVTANNNIDVPFKNCGPFSPC